MSMNIASRLTSSQNTAQAKASDVQRSGNLSTEAERLLKDLATLRSLKNYKNLQSSGQLKGPQVGALSELEEITSSWLKRIVDLPEQNWTAEITSHYEALTPTSTRVNPYKL